MQRLLEETIEEKLMTLNEWEFEDNEVDQLTKEFKFNSFGEGVDFINKVREIADELGHYPDVLISEFGVEILLYTPDVDGISEKDFELAFKIDSLDFE